MVSLCENHQKQQKEALSIFSWKPYIRNNFAARNYAQYLWRLSSASETRMDFGACYVTLGICTETSRELLSKDK